LHVGARCAKQGTLRGEWSSKQDETWQARSKQNWRRKALPCIKLRHPSRTTSALSAPATFCSCPAKFEQGNAAARGCAINLLTQVKAALGDLDKVVRVVRLGGFVNSAPDFLDGPKVLNGASDLMVTVFGDKGRHARTTVGVASLPADASVEVEGLFEVS